MAKSNGLPDVSSELHSKIEQCEPDIQAFIVALNKENKRLNGKNATLEAQNASLANKVKEVEKQRLPDFMSDEDLHNSITPQIVQMIRQAGGWQSFCKANDVDPETSLIKTD
jgi:hypothetical protein